MAVRGFGQESIDPAAEPLDRLPFQLALPVCGRFENGNGASAERSVIEKGDPRSRRKSSFSDSDGTGNSYLAKHGRTR